MTAPTLDEPQVTDTPVQDLPDGPPPGWRGPILPVNLPSSDARIAMLAGEDVPQRPLPRPFKAQPADAPGHDGAVSIGVITRLWMQDGIVWGEGLFDLADPEGLRWAERVGRGMAGWVSVDMSDAEITMVPLDADGNEVTEQQYTAWLEDPDGTAPSPVVRVLEQYDAWKISSATLVADPAFEEAKITAAYDVPALTAAAEADAAAAKTEHTGAMIALVPAAEDAARLAIEGGDPADEMHCTLAYLGEAAEWTPEQIDAVHAAVAELVPSGPILGEVWGHASFNPNSPDKEQCAVYLVAADGLSDFRQAILGAAMDSGPVPEQHDGFVPHLTAGYNLPAAELAETGPIRFDRIRIAFAGQYEDIPLEPVTTTLVASGAVYDRFDFMLPEPPELTALTVTDDGCVFGHLAEWDSCHIGYPDICVSPPTSASDYAYFHQGEIRTDEGPLAVGKITLGTGHASMYASARAAAEHYDNTGTVVAVVRCRDGAHGPWMSGRILPGMSDERIDELRRSGVSGDWRGIRRGSSALELVGVLAVNVPGFPVPRARAVATSDVRTLVAAGYVHRTPARPMRRGIDDLLRARRIEHAAARVRKVRVDRAAARMAAAQRGRI